MENYNLVIQFITTVGFPIAMCCALMWYSYKQNELHKEETNKLSEAINQMTLMLQQLTDYLKK